MRARGSVAPSQQGPCGRNSPRLHRTGSLEVPDFHGGIPEQFAENIRGVLPKPRRELAEALGQTVRGTCALRIRQVLPEAEGALIVEGTFTTQERLPLQRSDVVWLRVPTGSATVNLYGRMEALIQSIWPKDREVMAIGVASPGPLDSHTGYILKTPNISEWHNFPLAPNLAEHFHEVPVILLCCVATDYPPYANDAGRTSGASLGTQHATIYPAVQNMLLAARALGRVNELSAADVRSLRATREGSR